MTTQQPETTPSCEAFAAQLQVFANAWAIVGGQFDAGAGMQTADAERAIVLDMWRRLHTENEALRHKLQTLEDLGAAGDDVQLLRMGYAAARLEIESLKAKNLELERVCDATYVTQGADAYNHACSMMEQYQAEREAARKEVGAEGSLCDGISWLYTRIASLESQLEAVGAGGVGPLRKHCIHQISEPAQDALKHVYSIAVSAVKTKSRDIADWREDMDRIATIASRAPNPERSDSAPSPIGAPDTVSETAPERIWLQIDPHGADIERAEPFPADDDGVTWCRDSVGGVEVAYVRADLGEGRCALEGAAVLAKWGAQPTATA